MGYLLDNPIVDIAVASLSDYQVGELNRLKAWLYSQRIKARMEKDRAERKQNRERQRR